MEPIQLNMLDGISKIRQAHAEGRLLAQVSPGTCGLYRGKDGAPCAIGVLLTDEQASFCDSGEAGYVSVGGLTAIGYIIWPSELHLEAARAIQGDHDMWLGHERTDVKWRTIAEEYFLRTLDLWEQRLKQENV